jgi:hypothetical protein
MGYLHKTKGENHGPIKYLFKLIRSGKNKLETVDQKINLAFLNLCGDNSLEYIRTAFSNRLYNSRA